MNIVKRIDNAIKELKAIKLELQKEATVELFDIPDNRDRQEKKQAFKNDQAIRVINHLSDMRIRYKLSEKKMTINKARINKVSDRLKDSSVEEAIDVIDTRFHEWLNTEFENYLRFDTLFRPSNYLSYVDDIDRIKGLMKQPVNHGGSSVWTS